MKEKMMQDTKMQDTEGPPMNTHKNKQTIYERVFKMKRMSAFAIFIVPLLVTFTNADTGKSLEQKIANKAASRIEGAFGARIGDKFDVETAIGKSHMTDGTPLYKFTPINPYDKFDTYYILITPVTKIIYSIWAQGEMENDDACKHEQKVLMELLTGKYGSTKGTSYSNVFYDVARITQGDRDIYTDCTESEKITLKVVYIDAEEKTDEIKLINKIVVVKTFEEPSPLTLFAPQGTTVIWVNHSRYAVEIIFVGKQVVLACSSPANFFIGKDGSYESNKISSGGTASLCFVERGRYAYKTKPSKAFFLGKKGKEHYGTIWIK
jgi:hypothetical protein